MNTFTFTNKEEYLAYRANWKKEYKELSQLIRDYKFFIWFNSLQKEERMTPERKERFAKIAAKYGNQCYGIHSKKRQATEMLGELFLAKQEAQRQYLASKEKQLAEAA